ncbi:MAG: type II toxin-antitoxin system VapC family toxin [bacterium]|nr:type II toxin-antitoxin system VapC family toxin [bacterium]MCY4273036.1 type II toxin-antitoxin system VapC family toxin [bacterium]
MDTSYLYDFMDRPGKLLDYERRALAARETQLYVSSVSIWEMRLKYRSRYQSGARKSRFAPEDVIAALEDQEVTFLPMTMLHAARVLETPLLHKDPFDELLLVQAQEEGLRLLTADKQLVTHPLAIAAHELG